jgi:hypothetical protein
MFGWLASNPAGVSCSIVVINGFAVTATVIVTGGPVYVAPDAADDAAAGADEPAVAGVDAAADVEAVLGAGADVVAPPAGAEDVELADFLLLPHPARTIEPTDSKATSDTMPLRRL